MFHCEIWIKHEESIVLEHIADDW